MNKIIQLIIQKWKYVLLFTVVVLLIISAIFRALTPKPPTIQTVVSTEQNVQAKIEFLDFEVNIPTSLSVFESGTQKVDTIDLAQNLATRLQMQKLDIVDNYWENTSSGEHLFLERNNDILTYSKQTEGSELSNQQTNIEKAGQNALAFIEMTQLVEKVSISKTQYTVTTPDGYFPTTDIRSADSYEFTAIQQINNIPLFSQDEIEPAAIVWTDLSGNILRATFTLKKIQYNEVSQFPSLLISNIKKNTQDGLITYIHISKKIPGTVNEEQLKLITFQEGELQYRKNEDNGFILPYVRFIGTGVDEEGNQYNVEAITPAIEVQ